jgi:hypothetical protein
MGAGSRAIIFGRRLVLGDHRADRREFRKDATGEARRMVRHAAA